LGKKKTTPVCPHCGGKLYYDGKGLKCTKCVYVWRPDKTLAHSGESPPAEGKDEQEP